MAKIFWATFFIIIYCPPVSGIASCVGTVDKVMCHSGLAQACLSCLRAGTAWGFYTQSCCVQGTNALHHSYLLLCECASIQCILKTRLSRPRNSKIWTRGRHVAICRSTSELLCFGFWGTILPPKFTWTFLWWKKLFGTREGRLMAVLCSVVPSGVHVTKMVRISTSWVHFIKGRHHFMSFKIPLIVAPWQSGLERQWIVPSSNPGE